MLTSMRDMFSNCWHLSNASNIPLWILYSSSGNIMRFICVSVRKHDKFAKRIDIKVKRKARKAVRDIFFVTCNLMRGLSNKCYKTLRRAQEVFVKSL